MSIVLFVSASAFTDYLIESVTGGLSSHQFDLNYTADLDQPDAMTPDEVLELLSSDKNITGGAYVKSYSLQGDISREYVTDLYVDRFVDSGFANDGTDSENVSISGYMYFVDDAEFNRLLKKHNLKEADYYDRETPLGIALDNRICCGLPPRHKEKR